MLIGSILSRRVLRRLADDVFATGGAEGLDAVLPLLSGGAPMLSELLGQAVEQGWRAAEVALGEDEFWDHGQVGLDPADAEAFRLRLEAILVELGRGGADVRPPGTTVVEMALRRQCLWELRAAREAGALAGSSEADDWVRSGEAFSRFLVLESQGEGAAESELARALEQQGCVGLPRLLASSGGLPLLGMVVRAFLCQGLCRAVASTLQERPEQTTDSTLLALDILREWSRPRFAAPQSPRLPPRTTALFAPPDVPHPPPAPPRTDLDARRPRSAGRSRPADVRQKRPLRRPSASTPPAQPEAAGPPPRLWSLLPALPSPWLARMGLVVGIVLLLGLPAWILVGEARNHAAARRRVAAERQRVEDEHRQLDEQRQRLLDEQRRLAAADADRLREVEKRRRQAELRRLLEEEEARRLDEERLASEREAERLRQREQAQARLREQQQRREEARRIFERGLTLAALRDDDQARAAFTEALELDRDLRPVWAERGVVRRRLGDNAGALDDFNEALRRDDRDVRARLCRAELLAARDKYSQAAEDYAAILRLEPRNARAYREHGACLLHTGDYAQALEDETTAIRLDPADPWPYFYRANVHRHRGETASALEDYSAAIDRDRAGDPGLVLAHRERGLLHLDLREYARAAADLTRAVQADPADSTALLARARANYQMGDRNQAIVDTSAVLQREPSNVEACKLRGQAYLDLGEFRRANDDFSEVVSQTRGDPEAYYFRARARSRLGDRREAIFDCNDAAVPGPRLAEVLRLRGTLLLQDGQLDRGRDDLRKAHEMNPAYPPP